MEDCVFCKIARGEMGELILDEGNTAAFRDINPQAPVHVLVVPKEHIRDLNELAEKPELVSELYAAAVRIAAREGLKDDGYRIVANCGAKAGQSVWHVHLHVLGGRAMRWPPG